MQHRINLFHAMAREHVDDPELWDDCVQEALINEWLLRQRKPDQPEAYFNKAARRRILNVAREGHMTGMDDRRGHPKDPLRRRHHERPMSLDAPLGPDSDVPLIELFHGYDRDREVILTNSPIGVKREMCKAGLHLMDLSRTGEGKNARCLECRREARRRQGKRRPSRSKAAIAARKEAA